LKEATMSAALHRADPHNPHEGTFADWIEDVAALMVPACGAVIAFVIIALMIIL
jgi:hypothetical protein